MNANEISIQRQREADSPSPESRDIPIEQKGAFCVHLILPAYNEERSLPNLLQRLATVRLDQPFTVWVIDDGSIDRTVEIAREQIDGLTVRVVSHVTNLGLGNALQTGIQTVLEHAAHKDVAIVMDADDTHDVGLIKKMLHKVDQGADIVIASRFVDGGDDSSAPIFRRFLSRGAAMVFRRCLPLGAICDFTSGYRAYNVSLLRRATNHWGERLIEEKGFACMVELLLKLRHWQPMITEVPFVLRYDRKLGGSKLKLARTLMQYLKLAIRDRLSPPPVFDRIKPPEFNPGASMKAS